MARPGSCGFALQIHHRSGLRGHRSWLWIYYNPSQLTWLKTCWLRAIHYIFKNKFKRKKGKTKPASISSSINLFQLSAQKSLYCCITDPYSGNDPTQPKLGFTCWHCILTTTVSATLCPLPHHCSWTMKLGNAKSVAYICALRRMMMQIIFKLILATKLNRLPASGCIWVELWFVAATGISLSVCVCLSEFHKHLQAFSIRI